MGAAAGSDLRGEIVNIGSGQTQSINHLVELLGGEVVHIPKRPGEPDCTQADTAKARRLLGWEARVSLAEGVKIMLENIEDWRKAPLWTPELIARETRLWFERLQREAPA
jgi:UDP-glucose 4-epimerase